MHKLPRPAFFKLHFYYGRSQKKDVPTKEVKNSFTPHKNVLKEIQRLPAKEASILLQFIELPCFFELSCCFLMCIFLFMAVSFEINVTGSSSGIFAHMRWFFSVFTKVVVKAKPKRNSEESWKNSRQLLSEISAKNDNIFFERLRLHTFRTMASKSHTFNTFETTSLKKIYFSF